MLCYAYNHFTYVNRSYIVNMSDEETLPSEDETTDDEVHENFKRALEYDQVYFDNKIAQFEDIASELVADSNKIRNLEDNVKTLIENIIKVFIMMLLNLTCFVQNIFSFQVS